MPEFSLLGTGMEMLVAGSGLLILGTLAGQWQQLNLSAVTTQSWLGLLYLIVCGSLIGYTAYTWLLRSASISLASTFAYVNPLIAVILGSLLGQEPLTPRIALSAAVIIGAVVLISTTRLQGASSSRHMRLWEKRGVILYSRSCGLPVSRDLVDLVGLPHF